MAVPQLTDKLEFEHKNAAQVRLQLRGLFG